MSTVILVGISLLSSLVRAAILTPPSPLPNNAPPVPQTLSAPFLPSNITRPPTNTTSPPSNVLRVQCDGERYGRNLNPNSCRNVFSYIGKSDMQTIFSERHTGRPNDLPLPWRIMSNDGLCFVQPLLLHGAASGHASSTQMAQAAYIVFQRCVVERGHGGIAADIGGDNHLNIVVAEYAPHVRCDRTPAPGPPWESCLTVVADMVATKDRKVFGDKRRDPRVEVDLPIRFKASDARCRALVEISGKSTSATWYEIWEAMAALSAMCVRAHGKGGKAFGLGLRKNIVIQMSDENPDLGQPTADVVNVSASTLLLGLEASNASFEVNEPQRGADSSVEASTDLVQDSSSLSIFPGDVRSDILDDSLP